MIAQILNVELNAEKEFSGGKSYKGVALTYQPPEYKGQIKDPTTRFMFSNSDEAKAFKDSGLVAGEWMDIQFDNTKWKNPKSFTKSIAKSNVTKSENVSPNIPPAPPDQSVWDNKDKRIARAVAIKDATNIVIVMAANGGYTQANMKKREFLIEEVLATAKALEPYLTLNDVEDEVMKDLYPDGEGELPQPPFNDQ